MRWSRRSVLVGCVSSGSVDRRLALLMRRARCKIDATCAVLDTALRHSLNLLKGIKKRKGSPYSIAGRRVPELIPVLGSQPAGDYYYYYYHLTASFPGLPG